MYAPARSTFWGCCETDFWEVARSQCPSTAGFATITIRGITRLPDSTSATAHLLPRAPQPSSCR